jgi:hypothetical protein
MGTIPDASLKNLFVFRKKPFPDAGGRRIGEDRVTE